MDVIDNNDTETQPIVVRSGRTFDLSAELEEFTDWMVSVTVPKYAKDWREKIAARWEEVQGRFADKSLSTQKLYGSKFRGSVKKAIEDHPDVTPVRRALMMEEFRTLLATAPKVLDKLNADYKKSVRSQVKSRTYVEHWSKIVGGFRTMLTSDDARMLAIGLMGVTGRRFEEVVSAGDFELVVDETPAGRVVQRFVVAFSGQLKTRGAKGTMADQTYRIPVLAPAREVVAAFKKLRSLPDGKVWAKSSKEALNSSVNPTLNKAIKDIRVIGGNWPNGDRLTLKSLRALYAEVAYVHFAPNAMYQSPYVAQILGHSEDDMNTALSYLRYTLKKDDDVGQREVQRVLDEQKRLDDERKAAGLPVAGEGKGGK